MAIQTYQDEDYLKKYEERAKIHRLVPFQKIIELMDEVSEKNILDIGCGTGDLTDMLFNEGAKVTGIDISHKWINLCKDRYSGKIGQRLNFQTMSGSDLSFSDDFFDIVVMNMVLLNIDTLEEVESFFRNISRVLKPGGVFIFSDLHPILIMTPRVRNRYIHHAKDFSYFRDGCQYTAGIEEPDGKTIEFIDRHWTLETYSKMLEQNGMCILTISEPTYGSDAPEELQRYNIPEYILLKTVLK